MLGTNSIIVVWIESIHPKFLLLTNNIIFVIVAKLFIGYVLTVLVSSDFTHCIIFQCLCTTDCYIMLHSFSSWIEK